MKKEIKPFYVGQEVVANLNHAQGAFKKGDEFIITSIKKGCCFWFVTVGVLVPAEFNKNQYSVCQMCSTKIFNPAGSEWIFNSVAFSPKVEISGFISMKELAEKQLEVIGAN